MILILASTAWAAPPQPAELFSDATGCPVAQQRRTGTIGLSLLDRLPTDGSGKLRFNLFDDVEFVANFSHLDTVSTDSHAWWGTLEGDPLGTFTLIHNDQGMNAVIRSSAKGTFSLRASKDGIAVVEKIDQNIFRCVESSAGQPFSLLPKPKISSRDTAKSIGTEATPQPQAVPIEESMPPVIYGCDDGTVIDIMIAYTTAARIAAGGTTAMNNNIALAISDVNAAFTRSQINTSLHLVYSYETNYTETGNHQLDADRIINESDGYLDDLPPLRDFYGADCLSF